MSDRVTGPRAPMFTSEPWMQHANCRGVPVSVFYPCQGDVVGTRIAKAICSPCAVKAECLEFALQNGDTFGIWGGLSERQRRRLRRQRRRKEQAA